MIRRKRYGLTRRELHQALRVARIGGTHDGRDQANNRYLDMNRGLAGNVEAMRKAWKDNPDNVMPILDLSGQWAGVPTALDVFHCIITAIGADFTLECMDDFDTVVDAYEQAFYESARVTLDSRLR